MQNVVFCCCCSCFTDDNHWCINHFVPGRGTKSFSQYVCLSISPLAYVKTTCPNFTKFSEHVNCSLDSFFLWWQCNTWCTSSLVDDIMFSHNEANGAESRMTLYFVEFARWRHLGWSLLSTIALLFTVNIDFFVMEKRWGLLSDSHDGHWAHKMFCTS